MYLDPLLLFIANLRYVPSNIVYPQSVIQPVIRTSNYNVSSPQLQKPALSSMYNT